MGTVENGLKKERYKTECVLENDYRYHLQGDLLFDNIF